MAAARSTEILSTFVQAQLHDGTSSNPTAHDSPEAVVKKVWRFATIYDTSNIEQYDREAVEAELVQLFPDVARKGLEFDLWYVDNLAGEVSVCCCAI